MKQTTAKVTSPGKSPKYLAGAVNFHGFLARETHVGRGKVVRYEVWTNGIDDAGEDPIYETYVNEYVPYFNSVLMSELGIKKEDITSFIKENGNMAIWNHETYVLRLGVCAACTNFKITHSLDSGILPTCC